MNNISYRGIQAFLHVAEQGSFTGAARTTGYSKANISQLVSELETALGIQLLVRTTRSMRLTDVGEGYYRQCKTAVRQLDSAAEWAAQSSDGLSGVIRMNSVGGPIGEDLIAPMVIGFQQNHPDITIQLDFSSLRVDLIADRYDLVVRMGQMGDSSLIARRLRTGRTRYVASPEFLSRHGTIDQPEDLIALPLITGSIDEWVLRRGTETRMVKAERGMKVVSGRAMRAAALSGLGVTRLADLLCQADLTRGALREVLPDWSEETPFSVVCPPQRHQLARVRVLKDWITDRFEPACRTVLRNGFG